MHAGTRYSRAGCGGGNRFNQTAKRPRGGAQGEPARLLGARHRAARRVNAPESGSESHDSAAAAAQNLRRQVPAGPWAAQ